MYVLPYSGVIDKDGKVVYTKNLPKKKKHLIYLKCQYGWWIALPPKEKVPVVVDNTVIYKEIKDVYKKQRIVIHAYPLIFDYDMLDNAYEKMRKAYLKTSGNTYTVRIGASKYQAMHLFMALLTEGLFSGMSEHKGYVKFDIRSKDIAKIARDPSIHGLMPKITNTHEIDQKKMTRLKYTPSAYNSEYKKIIQDLLLAHVIRKRPKKYSEDYWKFLGIRSLYNQAVLKTGSSTYISKRNKRLLRNPERILDFMGHKGMTQTEHCMQAQVLHELNEQQKRVFCLQVKEKGKIFTEAVEVKDPLYVNGLSYKSTNDYQLIKLSHVTYIKGSGFSSEKEEGEPSTELLD